MELSETEKLVITTLAIYTVGNELEQIKIFPKELFIKYLNSLTDLQKEIVSYFECEKKVFLDKVKRESEK